MMDTFEPFTETDVKKVLKTSSSAFSAVDPMPNIVNTSLFLGVFTRFMKAAFVKPLIQNHTMDCNIH